MSKHQTTIKGAPINWECDGKFGLTVGFGATKAESAIANYAAFIAPVILYLFTWQDLGWSVLQIAVASFLALDMIGGVLTNSLGSMKRFLHTDQKLELNWLAKLVGSKFLFPAIHFQLFLVPLCFDIAWSYAIMMASILLVHYVPLYLQRPVAMLLVMLSIIAASLLPSPTGLEWLAPLFIIKLVLSHGVREEPYRPSLDS